MPGNTAAVDRATLVVQWDSYVPMVEICTHWTISKDQLIHLRRTWGLPPRLDCSRRHKPPRAPKPDAEEIAASEASLSLAPQIAAAVTNEQAHWTVEQWSQRAVHQGVPFSFRRLGAEELIRRFTAADDAP
jgi:hypothetical protein